ncbi:MAG: hypothetical protein Q9202_002605 [Teloschistes flavicans]
MSRVQEFLEKRGSSSADDDIRQNPDQNGRLHARMRKMGINRSLTGGKEANLDENIEGRPLSRQAIADRSRVAVPVFNPHRSGFNPASQAVRQPLSSTLATSSHQVPIQSFPHSPLKTLGAFDTDTEGFDDTTGFSGLTDPMVPISELQNGMTGRSRTEDAANDLDTALATPKPQKAVMKRSLASPRPNPLAEIGTDQYADDEFDDQGQFDDFTTNEDGQWNGYHPNGAVFEVHGKAFVDVVSGQTIHSPKLLLENERSAFSSALPHDPHIISSTRTSSISSDEIQSGRKRDDYSQALALDEHPTVLIPDERGSDVSRTKEGSAPSQTVDPNIASTNLKRKLNPMKPQRALDYDPKTLAKMSFQELAEESFDTSPRAVQLKDRSLTNASSLQEKLLYLHSLDGPSEQIQSQRRAFFSSLPIDQYEECGDIVTEHFSQIISRFRQARQQKRAVARGFEDEIAAREKMVERGKVAVAKESDRLKRAGRDVVGGK